MVTACPSGSQGPNSGSHAPFAEGPDHSAPGRRPATDRAPYPAHTPSPRPGPPRRSQAADTRFLHTRASLPAGPAPAHTLPAHASRSHAPLRALPAGPPRRSHAAGSRSPLTRAPLPTLRRPASQLTRCLLTLPAHTHRSPRPPPARLTLPAHTHPSPHPPPTRLPLTLTPPVAPRRPARRTHTPASPQCAGPRSPLSRPPTPHALPGRTPPAQAHVRLAAHTTPAPRRRPVLAAHTHPERRRRSQRPGLSSPPGVCATFCERPWSRPWTAPRDRRKAA
ncbi:uncharacterized protein [Muntiacus reevesi]|uniref:uncharacterized protein n=1 Tax=Muntiacus reevesi TaxID=9886 RepID=UPI003306C5BE